MGGPYICLEVGTSTTHRTVLNSYATAHGLDYQDCDNGDYICVGIGTGAAATAHRTFLESYGSAHDLETTEQATAC